MKITKTVTKDSFIEFFQHVIEGRKSEKLSCFNYNIALQHLENYVGGNDITFESITVNWFEGFRKYLSSISGLKSFKPLSQNSANTYFRIVLSVAKEAANQRLMEYNIVSGIRNTSRIKADCSSLTNEELQRLASSPCRVPVLKKAFLFSCLTGLSWKHIYMLKWKHINETEDGCQIEITDSGKIILVVMNDQALKLIGDVGEPDEKIFKVHYSAALCINLNQWALKAGVHRNITFNLARHTFGKMLLDREVPIELVSEMLGHKQIKTTKKLLGISDKSTMATQDLRSFNI